MNPTHDTMHLRDRNILIVEDEAIVALDLSLIITDEGGAVAGPLHRLDQAMALEDLDRLDAALLDVDLDGEEVFAFADRLRSSGVPVVFHTARHDLTRLRADFPAAPVVQKPSPAPRIVSALTDALSEPDATTSRAAAS